jgi:hypothetical protein
MLNIVIQVLVFAVVAVVLNLFLIKDIEAMELEHPCTSLMLRVSLYFVAAMVALWA